MKSQWRSSALIRRLLQIWGRSSTDHSDGGSEGLEANRERRPPMEPDQTDLEAAVVHQAISATERGVVTWQPAQGLHPTPFYMGDAGGGVFLEALMGYDVGHVSLNGQEPIWLTSKQRWALSRAIKEQIEARRVQELKSFAYRAADALEHP